MEIIDKVIKQSFSKEVAEYYENNKENIVQKIELYLELENEKDSEQVAGIEELLTSITGEKVAMIFKLYHFIVTSLASTKNLLSGNQERKINAFTKEEIEQLKNLIESNSQTYKERLNIEREHKEALKNLKKELNKIIAELD